MAEDRRIQFLLVVAAYLAGLCSMFWLDWRLALVIASNCFFITYFALAVANLDYLHGKTLRTIARKSDSPAYLILLTTLATIASALLALFLILDAGKNQSWIWLALALLAVPLGWATIHTMAAFHYAHLFWKLKPDGKPQRGLEFPGDAEPDAWDFVYFSFVIGMAAQTADVTISAKRIRRFVLAHSVVAYFFNAVLIAAAVNVAVAGN